MLIRTCSPFWFDFLSTESPQRLGPHCSIRTLPSFSSVSHTPSGEFADGSVEAAGAAACFCCGGGGAGAATGADAGGGGGGAGGGGGGAGGAGGVAGAGAPAGATAAVAVDGSPLDVVAGAVGAEAA